MLADLEGKGRRVRTVAIPIWVKQGINAWMTAAGIADGRLLRSMSKSGKVNRDTLSDWAVWSIVEQSNVEIEVIENSVHYVADEQPDAVAQLIQRHASLQQ